jgi:hypothetical protein
MISKKKNFFKVTIFIGIALLTFITINNVRAQQTDSNNGQQQAQNSNNNQPTGRIDYGQLLDESPKENQKSYEDTLYKVTIDTFEDGGNYSVSIPSDFGIATVLERNGAPNGLKKEGDQQGIREVNPDQNTAVPSGRKSDLNPSQYFVNGPDPKKSILGVKTDFFAGRKYSWVRIDAISPTKLTGLVKGFEVWVAGRNINHELFVIVEDAYHVERLISAGTLNFPDWRRITVQVPSYIPQENYHDSDSNGLTFKGFIVKFNLRDSYGKYYIYFDNLAAEVSRYKEETLSPDNPKDNW